MQCRVGCVGKMSSGIAEGFLKLKWDKKRGEGRGLYMYLKCEARKKKETR